MQNKGYCLAFVLLSRVNGRHTTHTHSLTHTHTHTHCAVVKHGLNGTCKSLLEPGFLFHRRHVLIILSTDQCSLNWGSGGCRGGDLQALLFSRPCSQTGPLWGCAQRHSKSPPPRSGPMKTGSSVPRWSGCVGWINSASPLSAKSNVPGSSVLIVSRSNNKKGLL